MVIEKFKNGDPVPVYLTQQGTVERADGDERHVVIECAAPLARREISR